MTNDEIRLKIAKLKGWRYHLNKQHGDYYGMPPNSIITERLPNWPESIEDAWELVEEAQSKWVGLSLYNVEHSYPAGWKYEATFYDPIGSPHCKSHVSEEDTAPLAICLAYIAWKESNDHH